MKKVAEFALIAALFLGIVGMSAYQLGYFSFTPMAAVHPQSQAIALDACQGFAKKFGLELIGVQVRTGVRVADVATDTAICEFRTGSLPFRLVYDLDGEFRDIQ